MDTNQDLEGKTVLLRRTVNSYLLFNNWEQASSLFSKKVDKIADIKSPADIELMLRRFEQRCMEETGYPLGFILDAYDNATKECESKEIWSGRRSTKKSFALKLYIKCYVPGSPNIDVVANEISSHVSDEAIIERFFKEGDFTESIDVCFSVLLLRQIIEPFSTKRSKSYSGPNTQNMLTFLKELNKWLKGKVGVFETCTIVEDYIKSLETKSMVLTIASAWKILDEIGVYLRCRSIEYTRRYNVRIEGIRLPGIWVDDHDKGHTRFWIFPENYKMAFCYSLRDYGLNLKPFEFCVYSDPERPEDDMIGIITPRGNEQILIDGTCSSDQAVYLDFEIEVDEKSDSIKTLNLFPDSSSYGDWFDWRKFERLKETDDMYLKFSDFLDICYHKNKMFRSSEVKTDYAWMIDIESVLVGMDLKYLYLMDYTKGQRFSLNRRDGDVFEYICELQAKNKPALWQLKVSADNPLYRIGRNEFQYKILDDCFVRKDAKLRTEYESFKEVVMNTAFGDQITLYHIKRGNKEKRILCFNQYSRSFDFKDKLKAYGVEEITETSIQ